MIEWLRMGGYGYFVWSSYGMLAAAVLIEIALLRRHRARARTRVLEQLGRVQQLLPPGVSPTLGPDASGVGWVYQYVLKDSTGRMDLAELRALQDFTVRPALQAVAGVAEVASLGGFERQYQVVIDSDKLAGFGARGQILVRGFTGGGAAAFVGGADGQGCIDRHGRGSSCSRSVRREHENGG